MGASTVTLTIAWEDGRSRIIEMPDASPVPQFVPYKHKLRAEPDASPKPIAPKSAQFSRLQPEREAQRTPERRVALWIGLQKGLRQSVLLLAINRLPGPPVGRSALQFFIQDVQQNPPLGLVATVHLDESVFTSARVLYDRQQRLKPRTAERERVLRAGIAAGQLVHVLRQTLNDMDGGRITAKALTAWMDDLRREGLAPPRNPTTDEIRTPDRLILLVDGLRAGRPRRSIMADMNRMSGHPKVTRFSYSKWVRDLRAAGVLPPVMPKEPPQEAPEATLEAEPADAPPSEPEPIQALPEPVSEPIPEPAATPEPVQPQSPPFSTGEAANDIPRLVPRMPPPGMMVKYRTLSEVRDLAHRWQVRDWEWATHESLTEYCRKIGKLWVFREPGEERAA